MSMFRSRSMLYLCDLFFIFSLIFIAVNHIISFKQKCLFFYIVFTISPIFLDDNVDEKSE